MLKLPAVTMYGNNNVGRYCNYSLYVYRYNTVYNSGMGNSKSLYNRVRKGLNGLDPVIKLRIKPTRQKKKIIQF